MSKLNILEVSASGRYGDSVSRRLTQDIIDGIARHESDIDLVRRDLNDGLAFVDEEWIAANFTAEEERTDQQKVKLAVSDALVAELEQADVLVIGAPIYNFGVSATLKAWIDMIARARKTFRYTANGPEGLLKGKKAYLVIASGGVPVDSPIDFATPYLRQALRFVGISDIEVIAADQLNSKADQAIDEAHARIAELIDSTHSPNDLAA